MAGRTCSKALMKVLTTPSKVANALDWRKSAGAAIATMNVYSDRIGIMISHHPADSIIPAANNESSSSSSSSPSPSSSSSSSTSTSYSLPMRQKGLRKIPDSSRQQLSELVKEHKVCGFVVSWPIQKDTGLMGASCGRTLFAIEELLQSQETTEQQQQQQQQQQQRPVFTPSRPICLWDTADAVDAAAAVDAFGRSSVYARTSNKTEHRASEEQYHQDESIAVVKVWEDFVQTNWPEIYQQQQQQQLEQQQEQEQEQSEKFDHNDDQEWDDDESASSRQWQTMMVA